MKEFCKPLLAAGLLLAAAQASAYQWTQIAADAQATYRKIYFLDQQHGFIVGERGGQALMLRTTTGGRTFSDWQQVILPVTTPLYDIHFRDQLHGYAVGASRTIIVTSDGGVSWTPASNSGINVGDNLYAVFFLDNTFGWIGSQSTVSGNLYRSTNGGANWNQTSIFDGGKISDVLFINSSSGWASASDACISGCLYATNDGGTQWVTLNVTNNSVFSLTRVADNDIWAAGNYSVSGALFRYDGSSWQVVATPNFNLRQVAFSGGSSQDGWAVGAGGVILMRRSGGAWQQESSPVGSELWSVAALGGESALAVGAGGVILLRGCAVNNECNDLNECTSDVCNNGNCQNDLVADGTNCSDDSNVCTDDICQAGLCVHPFNSNPCNDGNLCTQTDSCQNGSCVGQNPVTCTALDQCHDVGVCNPTTGQCSHPAKPNGAGCDDGLFCTVNDACRDGICAGEPNDCSQLTGPCLMGICDEDADTCHLAGPKPAGTDCEPCGQCDGQGACLPSSARAGDACDDGQSCTAQGVCDATGVCVIEGWCEEILPGCSAPAASYHPDSPDCRLPDDKVLFLAEVPRQELALRTPVRVEIYIFNNDHNSRTGSSWSKALRGLRLVLEPEQHPEASLSFIKGSAVLDGRPFAEEIDGSAIRWQLDQELAIGQPGRLSFALLLTSGSWRQAAIRLRAEAPCAARPEEVGCHSVEGWQVVGRQMRVPILAGVQVASSQPQLEYNEQTGCQCGAVEESGFSWLIAPVLLFRRRRRLPHERKLPRKQSR